MRLSAEQLTVDCGVVVAVTGQANVSTTDVLADALARAADVAAVAVADRSWFSDDVTTGGD